VGLPYCKWRCGEYSDNGLVPKDFIHMEGQTSDSSACGGIGFGMYFTDACNEHPIHTSLNWTNGLFLLAKK